MSSLNTKTIYTHTPKKFNSFSPDLLPPRSTKLIWGTGKLLVSIAGDQRRLLYCFALSTVSVREGQKPECFFPLRQSTPQTDRIWSSDCNFYGVSCCTAWQCLSQELYGIACVKHRASTAQIRWGSCTRARASGNRESHVHLHRAGAEMYAG